MAGPKDDIVDRPSFWSLVADRLAGGREPVTGAGN